MVFAVTPSEVVALPMFNVLGDHLRGRRTFVQKGRLDRLGEPAQPAAVDDRHVFGAAIGQLGAHAGPNVRLGGSRLISVPILAR